ncbi:uncharacterized protein TNCV_3462101 [Trichonephila clavipes]|nr:uncharacterized protein TNCV_3462101 [Trichonephila clavipes]
MIIIVKGFLAMLPVLGKKAVLEWCMEEGLIGSSYVCPKCGKSMELRERMEFSSFVGAHFKFHFVVGHRVESMAALVSEYTLEFFTLLNARGKKELIEREREWCMKEGLIASSYECPKCNEQMRLNERKSVVLDGFEWRCQKKGVNTHDNKYGGAPTIIRLAMRPLRLFKNLLLHCALHLEKISMSEVALGPNKLYPCPKRQILRAAFGSNLGHGSRVVKVLDHGWPCLEFQPSTTKDPPCRAAMHVKSVESSNALPLVWFGVLVRRGGAS